MNSDKKEIKELIKALRKENEILFKKYNNHNIHIEVSLETLNDDVMEVNPFCFDLRTGIFFGRSLMDGEYKTVRFW